METSTTQQVRFTLLWVVVLPCKAPRTSVHRLTVRPCKALLHTNCGPRSLTQVGGAVGIGVQTQHVSLLLCRRLLPLPWQHQPAGDQAVLIRGAAGKDRCATL
jgi:hypothetical protein